MTAIMATMTAITETVRGHMEAVPLNVIIGQPTINYVQHLIELLATFESLFTTTKWGGKNGFLLLVLRNYKLQLPDEDNNLNCKRFVKPDLLNPSIEDDTKGRKRLQLQVDEEVKLKIYSFQEVVNSAAVKAIFADVDTQYVEELEEYYVGYKN